MFFEDHEKLIYKPQWVVEAGGTGTGYDPLRLERLLVYHSGGKLYEWTEAVNADRRASAPTDPTNGVVDLDAGDVSPDGRRKTAALAAAAELELPRVARAAFGFEESVLDGVVLERLYEFLGYMAGKGVAAGTPHESSASSPVSPPSVTTTTG